MTTIETIRAELLRHKELFKEAADVGGYYASARRDEVNELLAFLDTLQEKSEKPINPTLQEQPVRPSVEDAMKELDEKIAKVKKAGSWKNPELLDEMRYEQPVCGGLEKEVASFIETFGWGKTKHLAEKELINTTARHFYELGKQSKREEWTEEDVENGSYISAFLQANCGDDETLKKATMWFMSRLKQLPFVPLNDGDADIKAIAERMYPNKEGMLYGLHSTLQRGVFVKGYLYCKEQMMKEAVEGEVYLYHSYNRNATAIVVDIPKENLGDNVRIIICKKED